MTPPRIRPLALCIFRHTQMSDRILVEEFDDHEKQQRWYRPLGGGIEFGECAQDAIVREIREELGASIANVRYLATLENIFTYEGEPGHEIVMLFEADFVDASFYARPRIERQEEADKIICAVWKPLADFVPGQPPLYPHGLLDCLVAHPDRSRSRPPINQSDQGDL